MFSKFSKKDKESDWYKEWEAEREKEESEWREVWSGDRTTKQLRPLIVIFAMISCLFFVRLSFFDFPDVIWNWAASIVVTFVVFIVCYVVTQNTSPKKMWICSIIIAIIAISIFYMDNENGKNKVYCSECGKAVSITGKTTYGCMSCGYNNGYEEGYAEGYEEFSSMISKYAGEGGIISSEVVLEYLEKYFDYNTAYEIFENMYEAGGTGYDGDFSYAEKKVKQEDEAQFEEILESLEEDDNTPLEELYLNYMSNRVKNIIGK